MFKIVHTYTGNIYSGEVTVEVSGFSTIEGAIDILKLARDAVEDADLALEKLSKLHSGKAA
jgi:hypothetical protein